MTGKLPLFIRIYFIIMGMCLGFLCECAQTWGFTWRSEKGIGSPGTRLTSDCGLSDTVPGSQTPAPGRVGGS